MNAPGPGSKDQPIRRVLELLDEQRDAMAARDAGRLAVANERLAQCLATLPRSPLANPSQRAPDALAHAHRLALSLRENAALAARATSRLNRALETLVPTNAGVYDADGRASPALPKRNPFAA